MARVQSWIGASCAVETLLRRRGRWVLASCLIGLLSGCALSPTASEPSASALIDETPPLGGEALVSRRVDLERAWSDMVSFQLTLRGLLDRNDGRGIELLDDFLSRYMGDHLDPLLHSGWQSSHPELMALDANLRLIKAEMLIDMSERKRVKRTLDDLARRFAGREGLLVEHPVGEQRTLLEALEQLGGHEWNQPVTGACEETPSLEACLRVTF